MEITKKNNMAGKRLAKAIKKRMARTFGGKRRLRNIKYMTYSLTRKEYKDDDTIVSRQLWYMHLNKDEIVKLDIHKTDTVTSYIGFNIGKASERKSRNKVIAEQLKRSRFFNFLYLLTASEAEFAYLNKGVYKDSAVDVVRITNSKESEVFLDLFVSEKGEIITSSRPDPVSGIYIRFGDEFGYEDIADKIKFPLKYQIIMEGQILAEGLFSDFEINKLSSFWIKRLETLNID